MFLHYSPITVVPWHLRFIFLSEPQACYLRKLKWVDFVKALNFLPISIFNSFYNFCSQTEVGKHYSYIWWDFLSEPSEWRSVVKVLWNGGVQFWWILCHVRGSSGTMAQHDMKIKHSRVQVQTLTANNSPTSNFNRCGLITRHAAKWNPSIHRKLSYSHFFPFPSLTFFWGYVWVKGFWTNVN